MLMPYHTISSGFICYNDYEMQLICNVNDEARSETQNQTNCKQRKKTRKKEIINIFNEINMQYNVFK